MPDFELSKEVITRLEAFKGLDPETRKGLIIPFSDFVYRNNFNNFQEVNRLVQGILAATEGTTGKLDTKPTVTAQYLTDQIKPWVEDIRRKLFNARSAPFNNSEKAQAWFNEVEKEMNAWVKRSVYWRKRVDEWRTARDKWDALWNAMKEKYPLLKEGIEKWQALSKQGVPISLPSRQELEELESITREAEGVKVGDPPEIPERVQLWESLTDEVLKINEVTGFTAKSVEMYILTDVLPVLPPFTLAIINRTRSLPTGKSIQNRFARVTVRGELTFEELRSVYRTIRRELGIKRSKRSTTKHLQLYQMVQQRGGAPGGKGKVAFWESLRLDWNKHHKKPRYTTWKGVKIAYDRLCKKMNDRFPVKTDKEANHERSHNQEV